MSRTTRWLLILLLFTTQHATSDMIALRAGQLIDGTSDQPITNAIVLIENSKIVAVGQNVDIPAAAKVIQLGSATLLPGMIEAHVHPMIHDDNDYQYTHLNESSAYKTLRSLHALQALLKAGWTSVRIAGDADVYYGNQAIRRPSTKAASLGRALPVPDTISQSPVVAETSTTCRWNNL